MLFLNIFAKPTFNLMARQHTPQQKNFIKKGIFVGILAIIAGLYMFYRSEKPMEEFDKVQGTIINLSQHYGNRNDPKFRYLQIEGYDKVFSIFIGHDPADFSPKSEQIDKLAIGDLVTVYHSDTPMQRNNDPDLDKGIQYLEKDGKLYYEKGNKDKYFAYFFIPLGILLAVGSYFRAKKIGALT
jgi:hypothetical protein